VAHTTLLSAFCILDGYNVPFSQTELGQLYRSHGEYVGRVAADAARLAAERFWLVPDATRVIKEAVEADVP